MEISGTHRKGKRREKLDTSTVDKVLDHRAMDVLNKLKARGVLHNLSGTFSSGKEANIYTGECSTELSSKFIQPAGLPNETVPVVLKIYKTSTMMFKDRERYVAHEKRFTSYSTSNSRKLIKLWAEKEVRNLKRLAKYGLPVPRPLYLKKSVLIMTMIGNGSPAPRLKDATDADWAKLYKTCLEILRRLYQEAGMIHADFSEYNLIYHEGELYVIDVAQSIERDHENSNNFLVMDIRNCNEFFRKKGVELKKVNDIFEEITGLKIPRYLRNTVLNRETFIPTRTSEVVNPEDYELFAADKPEGNITISSNNSAIDNSDDKNNGTIDSHMDNSDDSHMNNSDDKNNINIYLRKLHIIKPSATEEEQKEYNKKRKAIVKEMNRERRMARSIRNKANGSKTKKDKKC